MAIGLSQSHRVGDPLRKLRGRRLELGERRRRGFGRTSFELEDDDHLRGFSETGPCSLVVVARADRLTEAEARLGEEVMNAIADDVGRTAGPELAAHLFDSQ